LQSLELVRRCGMLKLQLMIYIVYPELLQLGNRVLSSNLVT
jgi:hypothetical protein